MKRKNQVTAEAKDYIFISCNKKDADQINLLCDMLDDWSYSYWVYFGGTHPSIPAGKDYTDEIIKAIENCKLMILLYSENSRLNPNVENEVRNLYERKKPVIILNLDDSQLTSKIKYWFTGNDIIPCRNIEENEDKIHKEIEKKWGYLTECAQESIYLCGHIKDRKEILEVSEYLNFIGVNNVISFINSTNPADYKSNYDKLKASCTNDFKPSENYWYKDCMKDYNASALSSCKMMLIIRSKNSKGNELIANQIRTHYNSGKPFATLSLDKSQSDKIPDFIQGTEQFIKYKTDEGEDNPDYKKDLKRVIQEKWDEAVQERNLWKDKNPIFAMIHENIKNAIYVLPVLILALLFIVGFGYIAFFNNNPLNFLNNTNFGRFTFICAAGIALQVFFFFLISSIFSTSLYSYKLSVPVFYAVTMILLVKETNWTPIKCIICIIFGAYLIWISLGFSTKELKYLFVALSSSITIASFIVILVLPYKYELIAYGTSLWYSIILLISLIGKRGLIQEMETQMFK